MTKPPGSRGRPMIGRRSDLDRLEASLARAKAGEGHLLLLCGEAGIGKTHLAGELAARAEAQGVRVLWSNCTQGGGAPAYWPWIQLVRPLLEDSVLEGDRAVRALIEVAETGGPATDPGGEVAYSSPDDERFRLFDAVSRFFARRSEDRPLLLVIEDLHWCDEPSLALLRLLSSGLRRAKVLVVTTFRDAALHSGHPLAELVEQLTSEHRLLNLTRLSRDEVGALVLALTGEAPDEERLQRIYRDTDGNPLFVREVVLLMSSPTASGARVSATVRGVVQQRLAHLPPDAMRVLETGAVIGEELSLDVLRAAQPTAQLVDALAGLVEARLLQPGGGVGSARYRFAHALVREAVYETLPAARRAELHRRAANALSELRHEQDVPRFAEMARHLLAAAAVDGRDATAAADFSLLAAEHALALFAWEDAARHLDNALSMDQIAPHPQPWRAEVWLRIGRARLAAGDLAGGRESIESAASLARSRDDAALLARAALELGTEFTAGVVDESERRLLEEALQSLDETDTALRARIMARLAKVLLFTPQIARRNQLGADAVAMARRVGDPAALAAALYDRHVATWGFANAPERLAIADEIIRLGEGAGRHDLVVRGRALRLGNLLELGDMAAWRREIDVYDETTGELGERQFQWHVPLLRATDDALAGRFEDAQRLASEGRELGTAVGHQGIEVFYPTTLVFIRYLQGRLAEVLDLLIELSRRFPALPAWRALTAYTLVTAGREQEARSQLDSLAYDDFGSLPRDFTYLCTLTFLGLACHELADGARAAILYELLRPHAGRTARITRIGVATAGPVDQALALTAATTDRWDEAQAHFESALGLARRHAWAPLTAVIGHRYGRFLLARGRPDDREAARGHLERAASLGSALGVVLPSVNPPPLRTSQQTEAVLRREGDYWTIRYSGRPLRLRHSVGLGYLARLVAQPGREHHALELAAPNQRVGETSAMPLIDEAARRSYEQRIRDIEADLAEAEGWADLERAERLRSEREALAEHLAQAVGLGGRGRRASGPSERARVSVTKAIRKTIERIAKDDAVLGGHLAQAVRTGMFCSYQPDPSLEVAWQVAL